LQDLGLLDDGGDLLGEQELKVMGRGDGDGRGAGTLEDQWLMTGGGSETGRCSLMRDEQRVGNVVDEAGRV
jgi:hypothetical protein